ncbi:MAG TPA: glycosyltransferase family 39 protein, partial [Vicinamibacteria bacterium]|nr:glycosyltransferase family 39 protein [Vicinamibacteria bacterium]
MPRSGYALLALLLVGAAGLRFVGLDRDVRRGSPTPDEWENFIGPVAQMWEHHTANPHVHGGYPGLFNWIAFLPMGLGARLGGESGACLAARALVAAFGTLNVLLAWLALRRAWGLPAAFFGAALLAVSRSEVSEAHFITPDVLVVSAFLALLLAAPARPAGLWTGAWAGVGMAVKYSGVLLFAAAAADVMAQRRWKRLLAVGAAGAGAFALAAPFALLWRGDQKRGVSELVSYYFGPAVRGRFTDTVPRQLAEVASWIWINL